MKKVFRITTKSKWTFLRKKREKEERERGWGPMVGSRFGAFGMPLVGRWVVDSLFVQLKSKAV